MQAFRILRTYWQTGATGVAEPLVGAGQILPADDPVALRQFELGNAEQIDVPDVATEPEAPAAEAPARTRRAKTTA